MKLLSCHPKSTLPLHKIPSNTLPPSFSSLPNNPHSLHFSSSTKSTNPNRLSIRCRRSEYFEPQQPKFNTNPTSEAPSSKIYVGYSIYKGKAALQVEPRAPEFAPLDTGAFKLSKEGLVFLQFAPAVATRQYDWSRKQVFSLSVAEIGTLISLGPKDSCEFFHDPFKGKSDEGKVRKLLKVEPLPDGSGHFFNLSVQNRLMNVDESIYIPVTKAEFTVLNSAFSYILPYLMGWHAYANSIKPEDSTRLNNNSNPRSGADLEWSR
ncbi:hypothetical protein QJS10_CPB14g01327 [Acorus calamus]|uniref:Single-stranded DNA-binding protein WHY1, chloroplastic n=1 Tax=Acorus calamus TaxID=4465 RepID=A0AAV9D9Q4_ACOCL|nr:hypothetical protein QJS10_CPB14g01327 [Acorus calamus]